MRLRTPRFHLWKWTAGWLFLVLLAGGSTFAQAPVSTAPDVKPRLAGKVVDSAGTPLPDVQLFWQALHFVERNPVHFVEGRTDADGLFKLKPPTERLSYIGGRPFGHLWVVPPPGYAVQVCEARDYLALADQTPNVVTLKPSKPTNCQLLGPDVLPRAGELVEAEWIRFDRKDIQVPQRLRGFLGGITDGEGWWRMNSLDEFSSMRVRVVSQTYGRQAQMWPVDLAGRDFSVRMLPTGTVEGQIVGTDLYRFEGREVRVSSHVMRQSTPPRAGRDVPLPVYFDTGDATTLVDREGRFRIPVIAAGQVFISLSNPPESEWVSQGSATVVLKEGETKKVEFASARKVGFEGKVEHSDGSPAEGARIEIHNGKRWQIVNTVAGADGTFRCQVCPGELTTKARIETFAGVKVIFPLGGAENITRVAADSTNNVAKTLRLPGLVLVEGEARDKTGMVIGGSSINLSRPKGGFLNIQAGPDGRFRIYRPENVPLTEFSVKVDRQPAVIRETAGELTVIQVEE